MDIYRDLEMRKAIVVGLASITFLGGCSGMGYAIENYGGMKPVQYIDGGKKFRIFDKPIEQRLMITPSIGSSALQGATFGGAATAEMTFQSAAQGYLDSTGRKCKAGDMKLVIQPQWETFYTCR